MYVHLEALGPPPTLAQVEAWLAAHGWVELPESTERDGVWSTQRRPRRGALGAASHEVMLSWRMGEHGMVDAWAVSTPRVTQARDHQRWLWATVSAICCAEGLAVWELVPEMRGEVQAAQPAPVMPDGAVPVFPAVRAAVARSIGLAPAQRGDAEARLAELLAIVESRRMKGIEGYGVELHTPNGRSMARDALEEAADLLVYAVGLRVELERQRAAGEVTLTQADAEMAGRALSLLSIATDGLHGFRSDLTAAIRAPGVP